MDTKDAGRMGGLSHNPETTRSTTIKRYGDNYYHNIALRKARLRAARQKGTHTREEWDRLVDSCNGICPRCKKACSKFTKDHITPIYQGGSDGIDNIQPLCRSCNSSKGPENTSYISSVSPNGKNEALSRELDKCKVCGAFRFRHGKHSERGHDFQA